ncbi:right-handed parallel beta-helix repeat-containing protein [Polyangium sp. 6x1]|uniref:right-handed parallel beta-helix repeat-containing protein n=1 Tax=Polyangium sp. 6x1 TaxID=3042689 RepID=UPI0024831AC3|nr:right-handed parallel beta-helix repeat-containing protein [Polyangium sp. 6x1]MDI1444470.1 right-handed parallel beta-helix repeat-containing protein [Polyangium sp. 6x1]
MNCNRDLLVGVLCTALGGTAAGLVPAPAHASVSAENAGSKLCHANVDDPSGMGRLPTEQGRLPLGQPNHQSLIVWPGQSIQQAIDQAAEGATIFILPGVYRETAHPTNGLIINKSGISLIALNTPTRRVVLENAGNQRNGIVVVPSDRSDCMSCHESMAPPFERLPGVDSGMDSIDPVLYDIEIRGITIRNFINNGLFTERVDGFRIVNVHSDNNKNYGIFPTLSRNGLIALSKATGANDSGIWVETSDDVRVTHNLVENNTNGIEVSNSDDIDLTFNVARNNTVGIAALLLPEIFDIRAGAKRINVQDNHVYDNNRANTAGPGNPLAVFPPGVGVLYVGVDESEISGNHVSGNRLSGIAITDYCVVASVIPGFDCQALPLPFQQDQRARDNEVAGNTATGNGLDPGSPAENPLFFVASDLTLLSLPDTNGNCFEDNTFNTFFSLLPLSAPPGCD